MKLVGVWDVISFLSFHQCFKNPYAKDYYRHQAMCCPNGTKWDQDHLSCKRGKCIDDRLYCPNATTTSRFSTTLKYILVYKTNILILAKRFDITVDLPRLSLIRSI